MAAKQPREMSNEELLKQEKTLKMVVGTLGALNSLLLVLGLLLIRKKGFTALIIIPGAMAPILLVNINSLKAIRKEKEARGLA